VASIFAVVERIASWFINTIKVLAPRSTAVAGFTETTVFNGYKSTLNKIIDAIETVKDRQAAVTKAANGSGVTPVTPATVVADILAEASKNMDQSDKDRVIEAKKELQVCDFATKFSLMRLIEQIESKLAYHYKHPNFNFAIATAQVKQARRLLKL
jgi:hypothetical protein